MRQPRKSLWVKLLSKTAWAIALVTGYLVAASALEACGTMPAPKYGAIQTDGGTDAGG
ncbi:MAG: hypothetical protein ACYC8T_06015 [Myxococcaceae bacterium]